MPLIHKVDTANLRSDQILLIYQGCDYSASEVVLRYCLGYVWSFHVNRAWYRVFWHFRIKYYTECLSLQRVYRGSLGWSHPVLDTNAVLGHAPVGSILSDRHCVRQFIKSLLPPLHDHATLQYEKLRLIHEQ